MVQALRQKRANHERGFSRLILFGIAALFLLSLPVMVIATGGVYSLTKHGSPTTGVQRDSNIPRGECDQCHVSHSGQAFALFGPNTNSLCYTSGCHSSSGSVEVYRGPALYDASGHGTSTNTVWPGADSSVDAFAPRAKPSGDWGKCINCHDPHGYNRDGTGLIPSLVFSREEKLCIVCHDSSPSFKDIKSQLNKRFKHPVATSGQHSVTEGGTSSAYGFSPTNNRHSECVDCHNPHVAKSAIPFPPTSSNRLLGVGRIAVANGGAGSVPSYTYLPPSNTTPQIGEYQVCFKCHSSWTTLPTNAKDIAVEFNTNNESFHPVEGPGKNTTAKMATNLNGGTGVPRLTTSSTIWCSDCHNNDDLPTNVSTLADYTGFTPKGPHGSDVGFTDSNMSTKILRANYRVKLLGRGTGYDASNFTLCFICHTSTPFTDRSGDTRSDTNFRFHGYHVFNIDGEGDLDAPNGDIDTGPFDGRKGRGNAICKECHYLMHSTKLTHHSTNRSYARLVSFPPTVTGPNGSGAPSWNLTARTCSLRCHGKDHSPKDY